MSQKAKTVQISAIRNIDGMLNIRMVGDQATRYKYYLIRVTVQTWLCLAKSVSYILILQIYRFC